MIQESMSLKCEPASVPQVLVRLKMCETLKEAVTFVEQGHIRVGDLPTLCGKKSLFSGDASSSLCDTQRAMRLAMTKKLVLTTESQISN